MSSISVWIPCQSNSTRVENKNLRPFANGMSLLEVKLKQLVKHFDAKYIYVSGNSSTAEDVCTEYGVNYIERPESLLGNQIKQSDLFQHFADNSSRTDYVLWVQLTDPLFDEFGELLDFKEPDDEEVVVAATEVKKHAFYKNEPVNFMFGDWHEVTQNIEPIVIPRWSVFYAKYETFMKFRYHFGRKNTFYITNQPYVDIDYMSDFELASKVFKEDVKAC